jgi:dihydrolipoamide dehydrogenase
LGVLYVQKGKAVSSEKQYDVVVIGSGPGGYVAAIRAAQLKLKTAIVEAAALGGVCLNIGCIPTKALLHSAELLDEVREGKRFGVVTPEVSFDMGAALKHKDAVVKQMTGGVGFLMKKNKIDVYAGWGSIPARGQVKVALNAGGEELLAAKHIILAVGSKPRDLPGMEIDEDRIISSTGALELKEVPKSLLIVGAGAIGVEFASMYRSFGSEVTLVEALPRIVPLEDEEISAELTKVLQKRGITIMTGAKLGSVDRSESQVVAKITDANGQEQTIAAERMLLGIGRAPLTRGIGLEELGVTMDKRGYVEVDGHMRTNVEGVYAIGDCIPTPWLAHVASHEGILAVEAIAGMDVHPINYDKIPACTYCHPEVASIGLTEAKAKERGYQVKVSKFPFSANGRASTIGERTGFVKIVADAQYDEILGIHMIGPGVTELIGEGSVAMTHEATGESLVHTIHAHPTLHEAIGEAVHGLEGGYIHI